MAFILSSDRCSTYGVWHSSHLLMSHICIIMWWSSSLLTLWVQTPSSTQQRDQQIKLLNSSTYWCGRSTTMELSAQHGSTARPRQLPAPKVAHWGPSLSLYRKRRKYILFYLPSAVCLTIEFRANNNSIPTNPAAVTPFVQISFRTIIFLFSFVSLSRGENVVRRSD